MKKENKRERWSSKKVLIAIAVGLFTYTAIIEGPDIVRDVKAGKVPSFLTDVRDGFMDAYYDRPPRY